MRISIETHQTLAIHAGVSLGGRQARVAEKLLNGPKIRAIMKQMGHTSRAMVDRSMRDGDLFRDNAAGRVGL